MIIPAAVSMIEMDDLFQRMEKAEAEFKVLKEEADRQADERERLEREAILKAEEEGQATPPPRLERGALVRINVGPFINHTATVSDIDYDDKTVSPLCPTFDRFECGEFVEFVHILWENNIMRSLSLILVIVDEWRSICSRTFRVKSCIFLVLRRFICL